MRFQVWESLMNVRCDLSRHEDPSSFDSPRLLLLRALVDAELIFDEPAVLLAASRQSDTRCTCRVSRPCEVLCGSEASKTGRTTSCSTCTGTVFLTCECACANADCSLS